MWCNVPNDGGWNGIAEHSEWSLSIIPVSLGRWWLRLPCVHVEGVRTVHGRYVPLHSDLARRSDVYDV